MTDSLPLHVLVIDDDADTRSNLCDILELDDYRVDTAGTATEALARSNWPGYAAIILDRKLPDGTAEELLPELRRLTPSAAILIVTGYADIQGAIQALQHGAADYILKPINADALRASLARIAERRRAAQEIERLNKDVQHRVTELQTLLDVIPVGIAIAQDTACRFIRVNPAFARMLDIAPGANRQCPRRRKNGLRSMSTGERRNFCLKKCRWSRQPREWRFAMPNWTSSSPAGRPST